MKQNEYFSNKKDNKISIYPYAAILEIFLENFFLPIFIFKSLYNFERREYINKQLDFRTVTGDAVKLDASNSYNKIFVFPSIFLSLGLSTNNNNNNYKVIFKRQIYTLLIITKYEFQ